MKERTPVQTSLLAIANKAKSDSEAITLVLLRKRVFTKSPVRENRTPGSVWGPSGNWQSYRDQLLTDANDRNTQFLATVGGAQHRDGRQDFFSQSMSRPIHDLDPARK